MTLHSDPNEEFEVIETRKVKKTKDFPDGIYYLVRNKRSGAEFWTNLPNIEWDGKPKVRFYQPTLFEGDNE